jgi:Family of unknown function (DUF6644)
MFSTFHFFKWCDEIWIARAIRASVVAFPVIETFHLFALTLLFGAIIFLTLRLCGLTMKHQPVSKVAQDLAPWVLGSLLAMLFTGLLLFVSEALRCYGSLPFWFKMGFLLSAITFHYTVVRRVTRPGKADLTPFRAKLAGVINLILWISIGLGGRAIAFL